METDTQYDSIKPVLFEFLKNKISFDIYIPRLVGNPKNINEMYERTNTLVKSDGFSNIIRIVSPKKNYHLALLAPHYEGGIKAKYYVKYSYGSFHSLKPSLTHNARSLNHYHGYLVYNLRDKEIFSAFSKTYLLPDLKHVGYKPVKRTNDKRQTILFLPSWEDQNNLEWIVTASKKLKNKYRIVVKLHPFGDFGTNISESVDAVKQEIREVADDYYGGEASLSELLGHSDLVVSEISGAVFDALYVGVPVIIHSNNIHRFDTVGIKSAAAKYADEGHIAVSETVEDLINKVPRALSKEYLKKQLSLSKEIFCRDFTSKATDSWMNVIKKFLNDEVNQEYIALHNLSSSEFWSYKNRYEYLKSEIDNKDNEIMVLSAELNSFMGIKRSARRLGGNVKRRIKKLVIQGLQWLSLYLI